MSDGSQSHAESVPGKMALIATCSSSFFWRLLLLMLLRTMIRGEEEMSDGSQSHADSDASST